MKANIIGTNRPASPPTTPFPDRGIMWRRVSGTRYDPVRLASDWFHPPWPVEYIREEVPDEEALLYIAWNFFGWKGYIGAKIYGFDSPEYANYPGVDTTDIFSGSTAFCVTFRPFAFH